MNIHLKTSLLLIITISTLVSPGLLEDVYADSALYELAQNGQEENKNAEDNKLESILQNYRKAIGGKESWEKMDSLKVTGNMQSLGTVFKTTVVYQRPDLCRLDFTAENMNFVESYDGTTPWQVGIAARAKEPTELKGKRADELKNTCDFDGPLVDPESKGIVLEYEGEEEIEGRAAYKIKVTFKNGSVDTYYLDKETYLPFMVVGSTSIRNKTIKSITRMGDFLQTGDIKIAYFYEFELEGVPQNEIFRVTSVEINPEIEKGYFSMPRDVKDSY